MGEKNKKKFSYDFHCAYCSYKGQMEDLRNRLYVTDTTIGKTVVECPKCETEQPYTDK